MADFVILEMADGRFCFTSYKHDCVFGIEATGVAAVRAIARLCDDRGITCDVLETRSLPSHTEVFVS